MVINKPSSAHFYGSAFPWKKMEFNEIIPFVATLLSFQKENLFYEDSSDEEPNVVEKVDNFAEESVPLMSNRQFKVHFRMDPTTFEDLLVKINSVKDVDSSRGYPKTSLEKEVMITIWYLGNIESFRSVANRFGLTKSTCWAILKRVCCMLLQVNTRYKIISWPNMARQQEISEAFAVNGIQGIVGCIDGSHIPIVAPKNNSNSYINRKGFHSILMQGICDHRMLFIDVYIGEAGSLHDYSMYRKSPIYRAIQRGDVEFFNDSHIIGDLAYKLDTNLLVGFKDLGHLTRRQNKFNTTLNKSRVKIENAFALLKGRFRRLKFLETVREDLCVLNIMGACLLHNICILNGDSFVDIVNLEEELLAIQQNDPQNVNLDEGVIQNDARAKRNNIAATLPLDNEPNE